TGEAARDAAESVGRIGTAERSSFAFRSDRAGGGSIYQRRKRVPGKGCNMRKLLAWAMTAAALTAAGVATTAKAAQPPASAAGAPSCAGNSCPANAGHLGCNHCARRSGAPVWQRLCDWFTYRAEPAPRECKCYRTCAGCTPPLYLYLALRF